MNIGKQIKRLRSEKNITQEKLADYLAVTAQAVSKWENEITTPDISLLPNLSIFFGIKIDELFRLPEESHFERIENIFYTEREISDENFKYAEAFLNGILDNDKKNARAYGNLAHLYNHRANSYHEIAGDYAKMALELEPNVKSHHIAFWDAYHAVCGDDYFDNHFEVIEYYKKFIKDNPDNIRAIITLIENLFADNRNKDVKPYIEMIKDGDRAYLYHMYKGDVALSEGNIEKAREHWNKGIEVQPVWHAYCCRADRLRKHDCIDEALIDYEKCMAVQKAPRITDGLLSMAQIFEERKEYDQAIECFENLIIIMKEDYHVTSGEGIEKSRREILRLNKIK